jgi:molybdenum cofactor synthesis domain-containing protein
MNPEQAIKKCISLIDWSKLNPGIESVRLIEAYGRVAAADIFCPIDIPPFARAAMDGYAVKSADTKGASENNPAQFAIVGNLKAGQKADCKVGFRQAVVIATGARVPEGADAVVMVEKTRAIKSAMVEAYDQIIPGENVSPAGEDIRKGQILLNKGSLISAQNIGLISAAGINTISVFQRPRVAIIATGDELVEPGEPLNDGMVFESNRYMISCMAKRYGAQTVDLGICKDDKQAILSRLKSALEFDMVVVCGGTSVGETDYLPELVSGLGQPGLVVDGVAMKPGSPTKVGIIYGKPILLTPGFPVSSFVAFYTFGRALLLKMLQTAGPPEPIVFAKMTECIETQRDMRTFVRVQITIDHEGHYFAKPVSAAGSRLLSTLTSSNGMVIVDGRSRLEKDEIVPVILLGGLNAHGNPDL